MKRLKTFLAVLLAILLCSCSAGNGVSTIQGDDSRYTIGVLLKSMNHQHWLDVRSGIEDAAGNLDVEAIILYPADESAAKEQKAMFRDMVGSKPDAILFAPCDSGDCSSLVKTAQDEDIPVIAFDTRTEDVSLPYIGADNTLIGQLAAKDMAELTGGAGKIAVISGVKTQASHIERLAGFEEELQKHPEMMVATVKNANSDFHLAMKSMEEIMDEYPDVKGVFCTSAVMGLGAVEQNKRGFYPSDMYIISVDTQDDALSAVKNGYLDGLVTQDGYEAGYRAIYEVVSLLDGNPIKENTYISTKLLTRKNIDQFIDERLNAKGGYNDQGITSGR
jgi:ribose transport system substrate-binding protein